MYTILIIDIATTARGINTGLEHVINNSTYMEIKILFWCINNNLFFIKKNSFFLFQ